MAFQGRYVNQRTQIQINVVKGTSTETTPVRKKSVAKVELKGPPFGLYEITMFCPQDHATMTESRQWHGGSINYNSFNHQSVFSERNRGGKVHRGGESSVLVVQKEKPAFVTPEWTEERSSPEAKRRNPKDLEINVLLKYPNSHVPKRKAPDPSKVQYESAIRPEVAKRDKSVPVLPVQKDKPAFVTPELMEEGAGSPETKRRNPEVSDIDILLNYANSYVPVPKMDAPDPRKVRYESTIRPEVAKRNNSVPVPQDFEDDDDEDEYDEFEEEIVIVDIQRKPAWNRGLDLPRSEPQKVGVPIEDLLQLPTQKAKQESAQDKLSIDNNSNDINIIDEKIESVQRLAVVQEAQNWAGIF